MNTNKYKITFVNESGKKTLVVDENQVWLNHGNFAGMGSFTKLKIKKIING